MNVDPYFTKLLLANDVVGMILYYVPVAILIVGALSTTVLAFVYRGRIIKWVRTNLGGKH